MAPPQPKKKNKQQRTSSEIPSPRPTLQPCALCRVSTLMGWPAAANATAGAMGGTVRPCQGFRHTHQPHAQICVGACPERLYYCRTPPLVFGLYIPFFLSFLSSFPEFKSNIIGPNRDEHHGAPSKTHTMPCYGDSSKRSSVYTS